MAKCTRRIIFSFLFRLKTIPASSVRKEASIQPVCYQKNLVSIVNILGSKRSTDFPKKLIDFVKICPYKPILEYLSKFTTSNIFNLSASFISFTPERLQLYIFPRRLNKKSPSFPLWIFLSRGLNTLHRFYGYVILVYTLIKEKSSYQFAVVKIREKLFPILWLTKDDMAAMINRGIAIDSNTCICAHKIPIVIIDRASTDILGMLTR